MKKRNLYVGFLIAFLSIICLGFSIPKQKTAFADGGTFTITFNVGNGTCDTTSLTTNSDGKLDNIPNATSTYPSFAFVGWKIKDSDNFITADTIFTQNTEVVASYESKNNNYSLSPIEDNKIKITATAGSNKEYVKTTNTLSEALSFIQNDLYVSKNSLTINFVTLSGETPTAISLENDIEFNFASEIKTITLSGSLNLNSYKLNFIPQASSTSISLNELNLNSTSDQNQLTISDSSGKEVIIDATNCSFTSTSQNNNYAIKFENCENKKITFHKVKHTTAYLYNHEAGLNVTISQAYTDSVLNITVPYSLDGEMIISTSIRNKNLFCLKSNNDSYTCSFDIDNGGIYLISSIKFNFEENDGVFSNVNLKTQTAEYKTTSQFNYPNETQLTRTHKTLLGFIGKITFDENTKTNNSLSSATWFFDKTKLISLFNDTSGSNIYEKIATHFSSSEFSTSECFTYYTYSPTDINYTAVNLMLELGISPNFVAVWDDTKYSITFEEKGGTDVSDISENFETKITLPTPTRTGYTFEGWYLSETFNESSKVVVDDDLKYTITDENLTFYAKWTASQLTLTIISDGVPTNITVAYDTQLSTIISGQNITKTGHSLSGWYTSETFNNDTLLDIETKNIQENLTIYAKWQINEYTISLYLTTSDQTPYNTLTANYNSNITSFSNQRPTQIGYIFRGWFTNPIAQSRYDENEPFPYIPTTMPATNLSLYAYFEHSQYSITYITNNTLYHRTNGLHYGDQISHPTPPSLTGHTFVNWYTDSNLQNPFTLDSMPNESIELYAKFQEKVTLSINQNIQSYTLADNGKFELSSRLTGFVVEYLINGNWSTSQPTKKGTYDVKITRSEDAVYKSFSTIIKGGLVITPNNLNLSAVNLILYSVAGFELIIAIILLFMTKQRKTYLNYAVTLPFGIVSNSQFINFIISLILVIFGLILVIMQFVKLRNVNIEIEKISTDEEEYTPPDVSENSSISQKVEIILEQNGFSTKYSSKNKAKENNNTDNENNTSKEDNLNSQEDIDDNNSIY